MRKIHHKIRLVNAKKDDLKLCQNKFKFFVNNADYCLQMNNE